MGVLREQLAGTDGAAGLRVGGTPVAKVIARLMEAGSPAELVGKKGLTPVGLVAVLGAAALGDHGSMGPALVRAKPPTPGLLGVLTEPAWAAVFPGAVPRARLSLSAGLLQIHDFWDISHEAAQQADDQGERACSAYWHGVAHRREPDAGNAAYWFRRVGKHPLFKPLALEARHVLDEHDDSHIAGRLLTGGGWNATAMIDLCTAARPGTPEETLLRRLQRLEMWLLLEATYEEVSGSSM